MAKYEIMLILDPKAEEAVASKLFNDVFGKGVEKIEKLQRTELAYEINKTKVAQYFLASVETDAFAIREFIRKANIIKEVWRNLVINLESERGIDRQATQRRPMQRRFGQGQFGDKFKRPFGPRDPKDGRDGRERREYQPRDNKDFTPRRDFVRRSPDGTTTTRPAGERTFDRSAPRFSSDRSGAPKRTYTSRTSSTTSTPRPPKSDK